MYNQNLNKNKSNIKTQNNREKSNRAKNDKSLTKKKEQKSNNSENFEFRNKKISLPEISNYYNSQKN